MSEKRRCTGDLNAAMCVGSRCLKVERAAQSGQSSVGMSCSQEISAGSDVLLAVDQPASLQQSRPTSRRQRCLAILLPEDFCGT